VGTTKAIASDDLRPHDIHAEEATLGALLIDPDAILDVREVLSTRDFFTGPHQALYAAYITAVDSGNNAPDYVTLCDILERQGRLEEIGGAAFITSLVNKTPTAMNVAHYAQIVARTGWLRRAIAAAQKIATIAYKDDGDDPAIKQEQIERVVFDLAPIRAGEGLEHIGVTVSNVSDEMHRRQDGKLPPGVKTGFVHLDKLTSGLQKSDLIIVAARPSMGKTALMLDFARNAAQLHGKRIAFFSLEMSKTQIIQRLIASRSGIDSNTLRAGRLNEADWPMFIDVTGKLGNAEIYIDDAPNQSASQIAAKLRRLLARVDIDLVVIDYLQCMSAGRRTGNLYEATCILTKACKGLAKEFDIPVVVGSQLSRACEQRSDKRPMLSDLRDSGSIEEDADIVAFIYRDDYYNDNSEVPNIAEINVAKHRNGKTGMFPLYFKKASATFCDIQLDEVAL